jgi:hypothetical protein
MVSRRHPHRCQVGKLDLRVHRRRSPPRSHLARRRSRSVTLLLTRLVTGLATACRDARRGLLGPRERSGPHSRHPRRTSSGRALGPRGLVVAGRKAPRLRRRAPRSRRQGRVHDECNRRSSSGGHRQLDRRARPRLVSRRRDSCFHLVRRPGPVCRDSGAGPRCEKARARRQPVLGAGRSTPGL